MALRMKVPAEKPGTSGIGPFRDRRANRPAPVNDLALHQILMDQLELTALNQFDTGGTGGGEVGLRIDQVDVFSGIAEDVRDIDHAGSFLVLGEEIGSAWQEAAGIVLGKLRQQVRRGIVLPDLAEVSVVADIFAQNDLALSIDRDVVEHQRVVRTVLIAIDEQLDRSSQGGI